MVEERKSAFQGHIDYGKWLIASMLAIHGGSIYTLMNLRTLVLETQKPALIWAAMSSVAGIALIMVAGFFAWLNFQLASDKIGQWIDPRMLYDEESWPQADAPTLDPIMVTLYLAGATGVASWLCFIGAASITFSIFIWPSLWA